MKIVNKNTIQIESNTHLHIKQKLHSRNFIFYILHGARERKIYDSLK